MTEVIENSSEVGRKCSSCHSWQMSSDMKHKTEKITLPHSLGRTKKDEYVFFLVFIHLFLFKKFR